MGGLAEFERELIRARTHDSRERANAKGAGSARALTEHQRKEAIRDRDKAEESFAEMKAWMRKNYTLQENYEDFEGFLELAVQYMAARAGNHFRSCHIDIPEPNNEE